MRSVSIPAVLAGESRGMPTAWAAAPLSARSRRLPTSWRRLARRTGDRRGLALRPLHPAVPAAARRDPALAERLALVDALRVGDARIRGLAADLLGDRLQPIRT